MPQPIKPLLEGSLRKCLVKKWTDGESSGYGFNLHAEMGRSGHFVGKVDDGSPAEVAGLREGDRIVEVNNVNIGNENHKQVVSRIKAGGDSVWLLVVDKEGDEYSKNNRISLTKDIPEVKVIECPDTRPKGADKQGEESSTNSVKETEPQETPAPPVAVAAEVYDTNPTAIESDEELPPPPPELSELDAAVNSASADDTPSAVEQPGPQESEAETEKGASQEVAVDTPTKYEDDEQVLDEPPMPEEPPKPEEPPMPEEPPKPEEPLMPEEPPKELPKPKPVEPAPQNGGAAPKSDVIPKMTAAQMREELARKKKADPRKANAITAKDKLKMFQNL